MSKSVFEKLYDDKKHRELKLRDNSKQRVDENLQECTFKPAIRSTITSGGMLSSRRTND